MTPEEFSLKERDVIAREKQADQDERKNDIAEASSVRHSWSMIGAAFVGLSGVILGIVFVNNQKNKDVERIEKNILLLRETVKKSDCSKDLSRQRIFYDSGELGKVKNHLLAIWANTEVLKNQKDVVK